MDHTDTITFEQALNEQIRIYLRFEDLFSQLHHHLQQTHFYNNQLAMETIVKIATLADRPDLKSKLIQNLSQQRLKLTLLEQSSQVDQQKLQALLHKLDCLIDALHQSGRHKIAADIRENPLLQSVRQQLIHNTVGASSMSPAYLLWLHQPIAQRTQDLQEWTTALKLLEELVTITLHLLRQSATTQTVEAEQAFYQQALNPNVPCQIVRVTLPVSYHLYPDISIGRHRLSIRFKALQNEAITTAFPFELSCCHL